MKVSALIKKLQKMPKDAEVLSGSLGEFPPSLSPITQVTHTPVSVDPSSLDKLPEFLRQDTVEIFTGTKTVSDVARNHTTDRQLVNILLHESIDLDREVRAVLVEECGGQLYDIDGLSTLDDGDLALFIGTPYELQRAEGQDFLILKTHGEAEQDRRLAELDEELDAILQEDRPAMTPAEADEFDFIISDDK